MSPREAPSIDSGAGFEAMMKLIGRYHIIVGLLGLGTFLAALWCVFPYMLLFQPRTLATFRLNDNITLTFYCIEDWSHRQPGVYYQIFTGNVPLFPPQYLAAGLVRGEQCHPDRDIRYEHLQYTVVYSRDLRVAGVNSTETPYYFFVVVDLESLRIWPKDRDNDERDGKGYWKCMSQVYSANPSLTPEAKANDHAYLARQRKLELQGRFVDDGLVCRLPASEALESLDLSNSSISDESLMSLKRFPSLRFLNISSTKITDGALEELQALPLLEQVDLSHNDITDRAIDALALISSSVRSVHIWDTLITADGARSLANRRGDFFLHHRTKAIN